jgi:hypothetical protein
MQQKRIVRLLSKRSGQFAAELGSVAYISGNELYLRRPVFRRFSQANQRGLSSFQA